jgi:N-acetylglucosaminyldiphosphoundecaprenol N-acetyl-beta-D-mannosaminyltransferase
MIKVSEKLKTEHPRREVVSKHETVYREETVNKKVPVFSLMVNTISVSASLARIMEWGINNKPAYVCFANVHMLAEAHRDETFRSQVNSANLVLPDGKPIAMSIKGFHGQKTERKAGMDFLPLVLSKADDKGARIFLYGSSLEIQEAMIKRIQLEYPYVQIAGNIVPSFEELSQSELMDHISQIKKSGAHIVLVSLGCPKQEKWMAENSHRIPAVLLGLGGAFPVFAEMRSRAPQWMQRYSLEWLYRLVQEPRRMFKRYLYTNTLFLYLLAKKIIHR